MLLYIFIHICFFIKNNPEYLLSGSRIDPITVCQVDQIGEVLRREGDVFHLHPALIHDPKCLSQKPIGYFLGKTSVLRLFL